MGKEKMAASRKSTNVLQWKGRVGQFNDQSLYIDHRFQKPSCMNDLCELKVVKFDIEKSFNKSCKAENTA